MSVKVEGLKEANAALRKLPEFARDDAQKVFDVTAFQVSRAAQAQAPNKTGLLRRSIDWATRPRSLSAVVTVAREAFYWRFVEFGTVKMPARPFFRPAALSMREDHHQRLIQALERAANKVKQAAG